MSGGRRATTENEEKKFNQKTDNEMKDEKIYLASEDIAERCHVIDTSYRTKDGRYIISENALRDFRFRMTPEEFVTGLAVELITRDEAKRLQKENGWAIGRPQATEEETPAVATETASDADGNEPMADGNGDVSGNEGTAGDAADTAAPDAENENETNENGKEE